MKVTEAYKLNICIVGADKLIAQTLENFLADLGHDVRTLNDEALGTFSGGQDVNLLIVSQSAAKSAFRKLNKINAQAMILLLRDNGQPISAREALEWRVFAFLPRQIKFSELEVILQRLIEYYNSRERKNKF